MLHQVCRAASRAAPIAATTASSSPLARMGLRGMSSAAVVINRRNRRRLPVNTVINFVPQQESWVVERFGKFHSILKPGLNILMPVIDEIKYVHSLKETVIEVPSQSGITMDNVTIQMDSVVYLRTEDPYKASYGVEDPYYAISQLAQTTMRSIIGKLSLDTVFKERENINTAMVAALNDASSPWGLTCLRCEIRDISLPDRVVEDMQRQVSAERKKRASVLESEGKREAAINVAEGQKQSVILTSEAARLQKKNEAEGEAQAILARAEATAEAIRLVASVVQQPGGREAVAMTIAQQYVDAFSKLAKESNTMLLPSSPGDPAAMVAQALSIFGNVSDSTKRLSQAAAKDTTAAPAHKPAEQHHIDTPDKLI